MPPCLPSPAPRRPGARRLFGAALAALLALTVLTACGGEDDGPVDERVQLSIFWWGAERRAELTEQALNLYTERHPEVTFRVTWQGNTGYYDRLSTEAASGNAPDLFQIDDNYLTEYAERGITLDLTDYVNDNRLNLTNLPSSLAQYGQIGGRTMGVAAAENTPGMIYNKSLLERLGLPEPRIGMTYEEFIDWAVAVTERTDGETAGTMDPSADYKALWLWLRSEGKELYQGRQVGFTVEDLTRWFDLWQRARAAQATPEPAVITQANSGDVTRQLVATGQAATSFMWSNQLPELQKLTEDELAVVTYPGAPEAQWARASMYWAAFRGTRHPEIVIDVINFLTNDVAAGRILGTERGLSANLDVRAAVQESLTDESMRRSAVFETGMAERFGPAPVPPPKGHARVRALLLTAAEDAQFGRATTRDAAARFIAQANAALTAG
ncbi:extracellular solute-binding protein [Solwaraspora sp. WMMD1047]|uniref:ABC transporter substrate-binding protein n=1 Tax=Solwaraspora sp. WMMD1047 TaxID=3016102 RepID=UPI002417AE3B|nr:extracellular solute-binding protein [Solwaraspora sp. WMMD1047]MDG4833181.1 extracellular solute-binding protein [Solwaraspora sp. WMMD1047]